MNHAKEFKTASGIHTNAIEGNATLIFSCISIMKRFYNIGTWNGIKSLIRARHRTAPTMKCRLAEFIFRRKHAGDLWGGIVKALKEVSFDKVASQGDIQEEFIYTKVRRTRDDLDHDDTEFEGNGICSML